jgi:preprotein translocase subunit SecA
MEIRSGPAPMPVAVRSVRADAVDPNDPATWRNAARNGPCPCGSGKKYKHCHGKLS